MCREKGVGARAKDSEGEEVSPGSSFELRADMFRSVRGDRFDLLVSFVRNGSSIPALTGWVLKGTVSSLGKTPCHPQYTLSHCNSTTTTTNDTDNYQ